jgi:hypothetical protein
MFFKHTTPDDAPTLAAAVVAVCRPSGWSHPIQPQFLSVLFKNLMNFDADFHKLEATTLAQTKQAFPDNQKRTELIDLMLVLESLCSSVPQDVSEQIEAWADALGVHNERIHLIRDLAKRSLAHAQADFYRNNYFSDKDQSLPNFHELVEKHGLRAYVLTVEPDAQEFERWDALKDYPEGSLGHGMWHFYAQRGFPLPGAPGGVNSSVAHHDWIHVLTDYDSDGIGEMEVAAFSAMATESISPTMNFLGVLSIFQGGLLKSVVGTQPHLGHELEVANGAERLVDALRRGRACTVELIEDMDFFLHARTPLAELRQQWNIIPKAV